MGTKAARVTIAAAGLIVGLAGCGSPGTTAGSAPGGTSPMARSTTSPPAGSPPSAAPSPSVAAKEVPVIISIKNFMYTISGPVAHGENVLVKNLDSQSHSLTSEKPGAFSVTAGGGGGTATFTAPAKPGRYTFVCMFHADMAGTLVVR